MATVQTLPIELLAHSFDSMDIWELIQVGRVCQRWRDVVHDHPTFWARISMDSISPLNMHWLRERLIYTSGRPFMLEIDIRERHRVVERELLDLVCATLHHVRDLRLTLDSTYVMDIYGTLLNPAPRLERFHLHLFLGRGGALFELKLFDMPIGIFNEDAPRLRDVTLQNVIFPNFAPPSALQAIEQLSVAYPDGTRYRFPDYLFLYFPKVRRLALSAGSLLFDDAPYNDTVLQRLSGLEYLELSFSGSCNARLFEKLPVDNIPGILISYPNADAVYAALAPLRSPFHLMLQTLPDADNELRITIWAAGTGHTRHFAEGAHNYQAGDPDGPNAIFDNTEFASQLTSLTISLSAWSVVHAALPPYPLLRELTVLLDAPVAGTSSLSKVSLSLPSLEILVLDCVRGLIYVSMQEVEAFIKAATPHKVELRLGAVVVEGDIYNWYTDCVSTIQLFDHHELRRLYM
ncbi:hypothetical protein EXIGLDRAFT_763611 [Exidia glandulosa HHB12029]|uniref:F-box domain-containing protein n=1 Tax=Exidia glandulosa HHB12029 TaxID=1314781 RepID=A0A165LTL2_EXIGL|nr:hypothetical protein EXIGLDRAFT_763611 [Exidia glandulosa HHB12029]